MKLDRNARVHKEGVEENVVFAKSVDKPKPQANISGRSCDEDIRDGHIDDDDLRMLADAVKESGRGCIFKWRKIDTMFRISMAHIRRHYAEHGSFGLGNDKGIFVHGGSRRGRYEVLNHYDAFLVHKSPFQHEQFGWVC
jgi:hypothetical protein